MLFIFADRVKNKSDSATKLVNKANIAAAKLTTSNGNGALNRYGFVKEFSPHSSACAVFLEHRNVIFIFIFTILKKELFLQHQSHQRTR